MLRPPYPYFGGKARVAAAIWQRFGDVAVYVEPFFGGGAVLLGRPHAPDLELANDVDGYIVNFWRAVQANAAAVAAYADYPAFESDLHARHAWLVARKDDLQAKLEGDPTYYDAKIAGWWVWGMSLWIGSGFCSGRGSWIVNDAGELVNANDGAGVKRQSPSLSAWQGVKRNRIELAGAPKGVHRKLPESCSVRGDAAHRDGLLRYMRDLQQRFRRVRVTCGDWARVVTPAVLSAKSPTAVLLDPPYTADGRDNSLYNTDDGALHVAVRAWAVENGGNASLRIAYCGYDDGFAFPDGWTALRWKANGGYANQGNKLNENASRETVWFSPHCLDIPQQLELFAEQEGAEL